MSHLTVHSDRAAHGRHQTLEAAPGGTSTFTMTVQAIGTAVADLTDLAVNGKEFEVSVAEKKGTDWAFKSLKFSRCMVTSANPSNVVIDGAPTASFTSCRNM